MPKFFPIPSPFYDPHRLIVHNAYHKMGTTWLTRVLESVASHFGLCVQKNNRIDEPIQDGVDILICNHSQHALDKFENAIGSHLIRDPRDTVVSGYFYHLWTDEAWVHTPQKKWQGQSFQQHLKSLDQHAGLTAEINRFGTYVSEYGLLDWNYCDPRILEIKYEDLIQNESAEFKKLFQHYRFQPNAVKIATKLALKQSFQYATNRRVGEQAAESHLRSGKPGEWRSVLSPEHCAMIKATWGDLLIRMGYESDSNW